MTDFLKQIGLHDQFQITLPVSKSDFSKILLANLDKPQPGFFDLFSSSKNLYKGKIEIDSFEIKRKRKWFDSSARHLTVYGKFSSYHEQLTIDIELKPFKYALIPLAIALLIFYVAAFSVILIGEVPLPTKLLVGGFIIVHAIFMFSIPYVIFKKALRNTRYEIERDLHFMMKDKLQARAL
jgi:pilus assembly protein TadC